jgi:hypothetical protein
MKRRFTFLYLCFFLLLVGQVNAQITNKAIDDAQRNKFYVTATAGTQGVGLDLKFTPQSGFNIRAGASILPIKFDGDYQIRQEPTILDLDVEFSNAHLMLDWHPWVNLPTFSRKIVVTAGAGYFWKADGNAIVSYDGVYNYGDIEVPSADLGVMNGTVKWNKYAPYLGFGFENPTPQKRVNVGFQVGAYYMGEPDVTLRGTNFLNSTQRNEDQFRKNMSNYYLLPVIQVNLNIAL